MMVETLFVAVLIFLLLGLLAYIVLVFGLLVRIAVMSR